MFNFVRSYENQIFLHALEKVWFIVDWFHNYWYLIH